ncbi:probable tubulin polyglutamylase ttll-15 [Bactrocera tryoni]|uniref:probable tubulin polyglutamylase ttll-15 n=1 Tax=Bactrocera tryoni TaxID=59916 RepID=UPI001A974AEA|nr:probable tubulin polyglutamylase ttll-15 [Bactrocera tryoni]
MQLDNKDKQSGNEPKSSKDVPVRIILVFLLITTVTAVLLEFGIPDNRLWKTEKIVEVQPSEASEINYYKFAIYPPFKPSEKHLHHVIEILGQMGYKQTSMNNENWSLLWAHEYPFLKMGTRIRNILSRQIVNHFPGIGFITSKVDLSTAAFPFMPKAFRLPEQQAEFLKFAMDNPDSIFVEKNNKHRSIKIRPLNSINLNASDCFIQEYVQKPFLVDGHKFDVGVYIVLTSIEPLIVYMYEGDILFRYCPEKYYPFDAENINKYVIGNDYLPTWEVPSLIKYFERFGGSMRSSFDAYVRDQFLDPSVIWEQVEEIVRQTILSKKNNILKAMQPFKTGKYFELLRFDLIVDDNLQVYLMEVNMSPNLSSAHFKPNALLYQQVLYNVLNLVGVGSPLRIDKRIFDDEKITSDKSIAVNLNDCAKYACHKSCNKSECDLCLSCLKASEVNILKKAHYEHLHKMEMKRIFPKAMVNPDYFNPQVEIQNLSTRDGWLTRWFYKKCKDNRSWC